MAQTHSELEKQAREHIGQLRRSKFGLDGHEEVRPEANPLATDLRNAIEALSRDLYAKDTHFIFELIQNAEDNDYPRGPSPYLSFRLLRDDPTGTPGAQGALLIENNERGLRNEHVDALCAVGQSTKTKARGYIGEKGIGFKSVFRVTSDPHLFSNGYAFRLPRKHPPTELGYIVPCWVDCIPEEVETACTTIILPLDCDKSFADIARYLRDIKPETILFLRKLQHLRVEVPGKPAFDLTKRVRGPKVRLSHTTVEKDDGQEQPIDATYWVAKETFEKPSDIHAEKRHAVDHTEVTVALPLDGADDHKGQVFAYLPVYEEPGLPFIVNADFLVISNREAIREAEPWNEWLRDCVADTFIAAFESMLEHPHVRAQAYRYLPTEPIRPFLKPLCERILERLSSRACVWTEGTQEFHRPEKCATAPEAFRKVFVRDPQPRALRKKPVVKAQIEPWEPQLDRLGVTPITLPDIIECLKDTKWLRRQSMAWFVECYEYLRQHFRPAEMADIDECRMVPVDNQRLSCVAEQPIYFECDKQTRKLLETIPGSIRFQVRVAFLRKELYHHIADNLRLCRWLTDILGVQPFSRRNYCTRVAERLVAHANEFTNDELVAATRFLANFCDGDYYSINDLPVVLENGRRERVSELKERMQQIATPKALDPDCGWHLMDLDPIDMVCVTVLSDEYVPEEDDDPALWSLLYRLGITDMPVRYQRSISRSQLHGATEYEKGLFHEHAARSSASRIKDITVNNTPPLRWLTEAVERAVGEVSQDARNRCNAMLAYLRRMSQHSQEREVPNHHKARFGLAAKVTYFNRAKLSNYKPSEFLLALQTKAWLVTTKGVVPPPEAFVDKPEIRELLADSVPYVVRDVSDQIAELLGIRRHATAEALVEILAVNAAADADNPDLARRVYQHLNALDSVPCDTMSRLQTERLIYAPLGARRWVSANEAMWHDRSDALGDAFAYLEKRYPKLKEFFLDTLGVKLDVDPECYARRWLALQDGSDPSPADLPTALGAIYGELLPQFKAHASTSGHLLPGETQWWLDFTARAKIFCQDGVFREPDDDCFVPDNDELRRLFHDCGKHFAWWPKGESVTRFHDVYRALNIQFLSEAVNIQLGHGIDATALAEPRFLTDGAKLFILTCLKERYDDKYERALSEGLLRALWNTTEAKMERLTLTYTLGRVTRPKECSAYWDRARTKLVHMGNDTHKMDIAESLARELLSGRRFRDFADFIEAALGDEVENARKRIAKRSWSIPAEVRSLLAGNPPAEADAESNHDSAVEPGAPRGPSHTEQGAGGEGPGEAVAPGAAEHETGAPEQKAVPSAEEEGQPPPAAPVAEDDSTPFPYASELDAAFNKPPRHSGSIGLPEPAGTVANPARRRDRTSADIEAARADEPALEARFEFKRVKHWEPKNRDARQKLAQWYGGRCQICSTTFAKQDGKPYFEGLYLVSRTHAKWLDRPGNILCLCANCCAKFEHGTVSADDIGRQLMALQVSAEGGAHQPALEIVLCDESTRIVFNEKHLIDLQELFRIGAKT